MRKISKLAALSAEDQTSSFASANPTPTSVSQPFSPNPTRRGLMTSASALCRFVTTYHAEASQTPGDLEKLMLLVEANSKDPTVLPTATRTLISNCASTSACTLPANKWGPSASSRNDSTKKARRFRIFLEFHQRMTSKEILSTQKNLD
jgi:hypothetical protein